MEHRILRVLGTVFFATLPDSKFAIPQPHLLQVGQHGLIVVNREA